jgi:hypothetical protein
MNIRPAIYIMHPSGEISELKASAAGGGATAAATEQTFQVIHRQDGRVEIHHLDAKVTIYNNQIQEEHGPAEAHQRIALFAQRMLTSKNKIAAAKQRMFAHAKAIGKGLVAIQKQGYKGRVVDQDYWLHELVQKGNSRPSRELAILGFDWKEEAGPLPFIEWEAAKHVEHQQSGSPLDFLPWLEEKTFALQEHKAWEKEAPNEDFATWKSRQADPDLAPPLWSLKQTYEEQKQPGESFDEWKVRDPLPFLQKESKRVNEEYGLNLTSREFDEKLFEFGARSGFVSGSFDRYLLHGLWEERGKPGALNTFIDNHLYAHEIATGKTTAATIQDWKQAKESVVRARHQGSHLPLTFEAYKRRQDNDPLAEAAPFILLNAKERKIHQTTCQGGVLIRNGHPFDTNHDKTLHSGDGYAIFVIGPNKDLYTGSHIGGVFHHSSFLGDAAVAAAGEIKTDSTGKIVELSAKSGHYKPTDDENLYMLRYFQDQGIDLSTVSFVPYGKDGKGEAVNAELYLRRLEAGPLADIEPDLFV